MIRRLHLEGDAVSLSEPVLHRAIDRIVARRQAKEDGKPIPTSDRKWLGENLDVHMDSDFASAMESLFHGEYSSRAQRLSWDNLPILNEWKRRFPDRDPVELHAHFWHRRLICPSGGEYRWNEAWQTMESSLYGRPGESKPGPRKLPPPLDTMTSAAFGLTFEEGGLRARAEILSGDVEQDSDANN